MMNDRLRSVLNLAFHPKTTTHEAEAALHAARRMMGDGGIDALLAAKERVVERTMTYTQTVSMKYQHSWLELIIQTARRVDLDFKLISCGTVDNRVLASMVIKFEVSGKISSLDSYDRVISSAVDCMQAEVKNAA